MTHIMTQNPSRILPGALHPQNRGACDWGWQSLLAYGCQNSVVVVDPKSVQVLQVLRGHKSNVVKVKWAHENYRHDIGCPYKLRLATGDATGHIYTWDASKGVATVEFSDGTKPILDMNWLSTQGASLDLLAVLHAPSSLILWNADTGSQLWKKSFPR